MKSTQVSARSWRSVVIEIPAAAGTAVTMAAMLSGKLAPGETAAIVAVHIAAKNSAGTDRAAFVVGDSTASLPEHVAAGEAYEPPAFDWIGEKFFKAASGDALSTVVAKVYLA